MIWLANAIMIFCVATMAGMIIFVIATIVGQVLKWACTFLLDLVEFISAQIRDYRSARRHKRLTDNKH
ncbi:hypothetical protein FDI69_gp247 [Rhodococcus phage Trina]|uniref:Uncharacterized protein n=1 Tax=Rhodococcus phage Trina TaxID=2027905 RepID=A0A2D1A6Q7_9CAUD|nr:hypothetical protein FDI69_gp247 [Rhodococcus phage Trina]ASZ74940.1 hypothetical protein SEA_TRINA_132 [Rhodococcus phage Trina]